MQNIQYLNSRRSVLQTIRGRLLPLLLTLSLLLSLPASGFAQNTSTGATPLAWSPDGDNLAIGWADGTVRVWNKKAETYISTLRDLDNPVTSIAWSSDGNHLSAGTEDGTVQVWDTETWDVLATLTGPGRSRSSSSDSATSTAASLGQTSSSTTATQVNTPTSTPTNTPVEEPTTAPATVATQAPTMAPTAAPTEPPRAVVDMTGATSISIEEAASNADRYYRLQTQWLEDENMCFEGNRPDPDRFLGGAAYMDECQDVTGQLWKIVDAGDGYYRLQTMWLEDEDKCLESNQLNPSRFLGGATYMDDCQDVSGQFWQFVAAKDGYYQLQSEWLAPENKCLEGNRPGPDWPLDGAAHMADCDDVTGQLWQIVPAEEATTSFSSGSSTAASASTQQSAPTSTDGSLSGRIAFPSFEDGNWFVYVVNADGSNLQKVRGSASQPELSPDGQRIAFRNWESDNRSVSVMDVSGGNVKRLSDFLEDMLPAWSPDGKNIVFFSRRNGDRKSRIHQASVENGNEWNVGDVRGEYPTWLPSGRIAYRATSPQISLSVMNNDGSNITSVVADGDATAPAISPDGKTLLYMTKRDGNWEIYSIVSDGSDPTRVTNNPANDGLPAWSPDGQTIAFASDRSGTWAIWLMNADGSNQRELVKVPGTLDGYISGEPDFSARGWVEERISWAGGGVASTSSTGSSAAAATDAPAPIAVSSALNCQVSIDPAQISYYNITGSTESELRSAMDQLSPKADENKDFSYGWFYSWNWPDRGSDTCDLAAADVSLEVELTMPCWQAPADASPELMAKWEAYIQGIVSHYGPKVENKASNLSTVKSAIQGATCSTADAAAENALEALRNFDSAYNIQTDRGKNQGAVFP